MQMLIDSVRVMQDGCGQELNVNARITMYMHAMMIEKSLHVKYRTAVLYLH